MCLPGDVFMNCIKVLTWGCVHGTVSKCLPWDVFMGLYLSAYLGMC